MDISRALSVALLQRALDLVRADNARLRRLIDEVPALLDELAQCAQPALKRWVWDGLTLEAETLLDEIEEDRFGHPPSVLKLCALTIDERLTAVADYSKHAELAARVLTLFRQLLLSHPVLCTSEGLRLLNRLHEVEYNPIGSADETPYHQQK